MKTIEELETEFIVKLVNQRFKSERGFYHDILNQRTWDRIKLGESKLWNTTVKNYQKILDRLFTPYEQYLLKQARQHVQFNWSKTLNEAYNKLKIQHAKYMVANGAQINVNSAFESYPGDQRINQGTSLKVEDDLGNYLTFIINIPSKQVPSGRQNRKEWFENEFEKVVVL